MDVTVRIEGIDALTQAIERLAGISPAQQAGSQNAGAGTFVQQPTLQQAPVQNMVPPMQAPMQQPPMQQPQQFQMQQPAPQPQQPQQQMPMSGLPTTAVAQEYTQDQFAVACAALVNQGKQPKLMQLLQGFGVQALTQLPKERYGELATALRAEGAVI